MDYWDIDKIIMVVGVVYFIFLLKFFLSVNFLNLKGVNIMEIMGFIFF